MKKLHGMGTWRRWTRLAALTAALTLPLPAVAVAATPAEQLNEVFGYIEDLHVSGTSGEALRDAAIRGMLDELNDPYTAYYDEAMWKSLHDAYEQVMVGIGIQYAQTDEGLRILRVYADSAAEDAGLRAGDVVVGVGGKAVKSHPLEEITNDLLGPAGTEAKLDVLDGASRKKKTVVVTRRAFHIPSVTYELMDGGVGYIRIDSFSSDTAARFGDAMWTFANEPSLAAIVVDVRGNPGGYLDAARSVSSFFIEEGPLLHTIDRNGVEVALEIEGGGKVGLPVAVLVDGNSASASEVFAGAMQDYGVGTIVGAKTFGKGSVQQLIELQGGGGLKVTIEHYLTPKMNPVNGVGITPDAAATHPLDATVTALREVGIANVRAELRSYETVVNGATFGHVINVVREGGRVYVPSQALAALSGGDAKWDGATSAVTIDGGGRTAAFAAGSGLLLKDGTGYIDVGAFAKAFPNATAKSSRSTVVLEWSDHG
ncbi:PDZ domain-containing protein [Paenibacillus antri]|uniref:PDZ domain-containing protein n=1 Tax=Paenibacillus antri TaxID=2582848 RepID=A0A5R9GGD4_9BACL|nr:S41 family peptidase [Paenibacillus antri]TLS53220.1 PDZ domain-containing protein [Paenibacillus antri]